MTVTITQASSWVKAEGKEMRACHVEDWVLDLGTV
jgi:hypothetical protein